MASVTQLGPSPLPRREKENPAGGAGGGGMPRVESDKAPPNPLTFPRSSEAFSDALFRNPTSEYRGCPLWAWNAKLDKDQLRRQIDCFKDMGLGGFHMHVRVGLDTEYMGDEFMELVKFCVDYAEEKGLLACLYDDDRWPSGVVGGRLIEKFPEHKAKHILFTPHPYGTVGPVRGCTPSSAAACRSENGRLLARYSIILDGEGNLAEAKVLEDGQSADGDTWYAYVETNPPSPWFNGQTYVDTLSQGAIAEFVKSTHEVYKEKVGDRFGTTIPCSFTDEPQFATKTQLPNPRAKQDIFLPWTDDLPRTFADSYGRDADLVRRLPELVWNLPRGQPSSTRYHYHDHVCERFVSAYMDQLSEWCGRNNIMLNGHMMEEPTLFSQTTALGEAMRCYRKMQLPGIDLLSDSFEYTTAKQASSIARQRGLRACGSETYGCTHWTFSFEGHKGCSDWQAALGITFRVPHLSWMSMAGEGKRDYPASINYQSPWYKEYGYVEDHFARVNVALTRGRPVTRVAVVHPIESYWLCFGPEGTSDEMQRRDEAFEDLTSWLLHGLVDFDFISESLLPGQFGGYVDKKLHVGACAYDLVVLPNLRTIRSSTFEIIVQGFVSAGGEVLIAGEWPRLMDGRPPGAGFHAALRGGNLLPWDKGLIMSYMEPYRDVKVVPSRPSDSAEDLLYQLREDGEDRYVFICNTDRNNALEGNVLLRGNWNVFALDTLSGKQSWTKSWRTREWTIFQHKWEGCASLLLRLLPAETRLYPAATDSPMSEKAEEIGPTELSVQLHSAQLSELNVMMLDYALYRVDGGKWAGRQEILQIDNEMRDKLYLPRKGYAWKQPWSIPPAERQPKATVTLKFPFWSYCAVESPAFLALEMQDGLKIKLNGNPVGLVPTLALGGKAWWVDEAISVLALGCDAIHMGCNALELELPYGVLTNLERVYILGQFNVNLKGPNAEIHAPGKPVTWGDITTQGLPFYVGNVEYDIEFKTEMPCSAVLSVPHFSSPVLRVDKLDNRNWTKVGNIAVQPRQLDLGILEPGPHRYRLTAFGNRFNAFGHVHLPDWVTGCWPDVWRTKEWAWVDEYNIKPIGILEQPKIILRILG